MNRNSELPKREFKKKSGVNPASYFVKAVVLIVLLSGAGFAGLSGSRRVLSSTFFSVKNVKISPTILMKEDDIVRISGFKAGENLFRLNTGEMENRLKAYPWIGGASVQKKFPDTLLITVTERFPFAIVLSEKIYLVDREGFILSVLGKLPDLSTPVITDSKKHLASPGERLESPAFSIGRQVILAASGRLLEYESEVASVELAGDGKVRVLLRSSSVPVILDSFNIEEGFSRLSYMKNILEEEGVKEVDFSFRNQAVVKRENPENMKRENLALAGEL